MELIDIIFIVIAPLAILYIVYDAIIDRIDRGEQYGNESEFQ